jgi:hypothetical protein
MFAVVVYYPMPGMLSVLLNDIVVVEAVAEG